MIGLLRKEFYGLNSLYKKTLPMVAILYGILVVATENDFFLYFGIWVMVFYSISNLSLDENCGWGRYARTLPISTVQIVGAKFLISAGYTLAGLLYGLAAGTIQRLIHHTGGYREMVLSAILVTVVAMLMIFAMYPFSLKFGLEKTRNGTLVIWMVVFGGFLLFGEQLNQVLPLEQVAASFSTHFIWWTVGVCAVGILLILLLFALSVHIYHTKEV